MCKSAYVTGKRANLPGPFLSFQKINPFEQKQVVVTPVKNNKWILWGAIIAVLFILLLFTQKMVKEVNKRKEHDSI